MLHSVVTQPRGDDWERSLQEKEPCTVDQFESSIIHLAGDVQESGDHRIRAGGTGWLRMRLQYAAKQFPVLGIRLSQRRQDQRDAICTNAGAESARHGGYDKKFQKVINHATWSPTDPAEVANDKREKERQRITRGWFETQPARSTYRAISTQTYVEYATTPLLHLLFYSLYRTLPKTPLSERRKNPIEIRSSFLSSFLSSIYIALCYREWPSRY